MFKSKNVACSLQVLVLIAWGRYIRYLYEEENPPSSKKKERGFPSYELGNI